ncbi:hypothetical protein BSKO_04213 [Bryopsis sp. KO-2023]|nr:hypothetical protein BSKO_04213 [Bryopsis sp. KO-2023]
MFVSNAFQISRYCLAKSDKNRGQASPPQGAFLGEQAYLSLSPFSNAKALESECLWGGVRVKVTFMGGGGDEKNMFTFDKLYDQGTSQGCVFEDVKHVVRSVLDGYNGTILAYGQTGSGKTHTLIGVMNDSELRGVVPRAVGELAAGIRSDDSGCKYDVRASAVEIYCERICDLLDSRNYDLQVKQDSNRGIYVAGATEVSVVGEDQLVALMEGAIANRSVSATEMNSGSSRSHCIVYIMVEKQKCDGSIQYAKLCMVDLAGSERQAKTGATGVTLDEGILINKSLSALANVISALTDGKSKHIPYRDSKLTRVLQDSLGGTSKTTLIVCCSPCKDNAAESLSSLRFGSRAKGITNTVQLNVRSGGGSVERLLKEAKDYCEKLQEEVRLLQETATRQRAAPVDLGEASRRLREALFVEKSTFAAKLNSLRMYCIAVLASRERTFVAMATIDQSAGRMLTAVVSLPSERMLVEVVSPTNVTESISTVKVPPTESLNLGEAANPTRRRAICCDRESMNNFLTGLNPSNWAARVACWWLNINYTTWKSQQDDGGGVRHVKERNLRKVLHVESETQSPEALIASGDTQQQSPTDGARSLTAFSRDSLSLPAIPEIDSWDLDIFAVAGATNNFPLYSITCAILDRENLWDSLNLNRWKVENFLYEIERRYLDNPYHNKTHAADVVQAAYVIYKQCRNVKISDLELLCLLLASAVHDVEHQGVNNDFMITTRSPLAITYNDRSVNENHHASTAFRIMENENFNVFDGFTKANVDRARRLIIDMVLSTDMALHFELMKRFNEKLEVVAGDMNKWECKSLLLQMILHIADISNPARPFPVASRWAELVIMEFLQQGDREKSLGLEVSAACDRNKVRLPIAQRNFIKLFLKPTLNRYECFVDPDLMSVLRFNLDVTLQTWELLAAELEQGKR